MIEQAPGGNRGQNARVRVQAADGVWRTFEGKKFPQHREFRVYRVEGDITNRDALEDSAEQLAAHFDVQHVTMRV
jgi:hypothetical protein